MDKQLLNMVAQLFVFGVRAIVASNINPDGHGPSHLGSPQAHLRLLQDQLDAIMEPDKLLPGHTLKGFGFDK